MKKVKKSLLIVFALIMVLATVFAFVGCKDNSKDKEAKSIAIVIDGEKVMLEEGATLDALKSAITVEVTMSDGSKTTITDYTISGFDPNAEGEQTVTVTYGKLNGTVKVEVSKSRDEPTPASLEIQVDGAKVELSENNATVDAIKAHITVSIVYSDNSKNVVSDYEVDGFNPSAEGEQTVTIKHSGLENTLIVVVNHAQEAELKSINVATEGNISFEQGYASIDALKALITVTAEYTDGSSVVVEDYEVIGLDVDNVGEQTITVKYEDKTTTVYVTILEPIVSSDYKVIVNGTTEIALVVLDCDDPNVTAQYSATFNLAKDGVITVVDNDGNEYVNYEENCTFKGTALLDGEHKIYLKFYQDGGDSIWVTQPENENPNPNPSDYKVVVNGTTEIALVVLDCDDPNVTAQYSATFNLAKDDVITVVDNDGNGYVNYEENCTFKGTALLDGEHKIYLKFYQDGGDSIWVTQPENENPNPEVEIKADSVVVLTVGETTVELELNPSSLGGNVEFMATGVELKVGDVVVITVDGNVYANYKDCGFDGKATVDGTHDFYVASDGIWVTVPTVVDPDPTPDPEYTVSVVINGDVENAIVLTAQESEYCSMEYTGTFTLSVGDTIKVLASDGYEYVTYENADDFNGTAKVAGEYTIYVKCYEDLSNKIYTVVPQGEIVDPDPTPETYKVVVGGNEIVLEVLASDDENVIAQYSAKFNLTKGDVIEVVDNNGKSYANYEENCTFKGTALVDGEHTIYLKFYQDGGNSIWVTQPENENPNPNPEVEIKADSVVVLTVGETTVELELNPSSIGGNVEFMATGIELKVGDVVVITVDGNVYANYKDCGFDGKATVEGTHDFYVASDGIWVTVPTVVDPDPTPDPEYTVSVVINGDVENAIVLTAQESEYCSMEYTGTFTLAVGDTIKVLASDGYEFVTYENADAFDGTAKVAGEYTIYVKCNDDMSNSIYTIAPTVVDPDPTPEVEIKADSVVVLTVGETTVELELNTSSIGGNVEFMATGVELKVGDIVVITVDGNVYANYKDCGFDGKATVEGTHDFYVANDGIWVTVPTVVDPDPTPDPEYTVSVVINGDVENAIVLTAQESEYCSMEYTGTFTLAVGDTIKVLASDGYEYVTYENADAFDGTAKVAGEYTIYVKCNDDMSNSIYTIAPTVDPDPTPEVEIKADSVVVLTVGETTVELELNTSSIGGNVEFMATGVELKVGDVVVITVDGNVYANYKDCGFDGKATVDGTHDFYVASDGIWVTVPTVVDPDPTPDVEIKADSVVVLTVGETTVELQLNPSSIGGNVEFMATGVELKVGDVVVITVDGNVYANYKDCGFDGKATVNGTHDFYVASDGIWVTVPTVVDPNPTPDPEYTVSVVINGDVENAIVLTAQESEYCSMEYTGTFTLAVGDTIKVIASDGYEYVNYENADEFEGTAKVAGEYTIYVKCYDDMYNAIYTSVPSSIVVPDPDVKSITVYYYNKDNWSNVYSYAWNDNGNAGDWPGVAMTAVEGHDGWYSIEVSTTFSNIIFNAGSGKPQTPDLKIDANNVYYNGYNWTDGYTLNEGKTTRTVYFYNKDNWSKVNAYAWTGMDSNGIWPGLDMTAVEGHDGWYSIEVSFDHAYIIFNDGSAQTKDIVIDTSSDTVYYNDGWVKSM